MLLYLRCPKTFMQVISAISSVDLQIQICLDVVGSAVPTFLHKLKEPELWENFPKQQNNLYLLHKILSGDVHSALMNRFLEKNAFKDVNKCLRRIKDASRHNVIHNAICITNGFLSYGTNDDKFLRDNMNWLSKFQCWSCFSASTTVGQIHYGNESNPIEILQAFLPQKNSQTTSNTTNNSSSPGSNHNYFSESGAYLALGLMAPGRNLDKINNYFIDEMDAAHASDFLLHGLSAGLGASAAFSHSPDILEKLKANLFLDETLVGQSSAISVGLVAAGGLDQFEDEFKELQEFSLQTSHEKIMLGCGLGQAMIVCLNPPLNDSVDHVMQFGENSNLDRIINNIEPSIRLGAVNCIAMAYAGTCNCNAIRLLLNLISDDVSDMVKRGAVIALGFIFLRRRSLAFDIIEPLLSHHNQHIRFGAALAFGVCFASTGSDRALTLLMSCQDQSAGFVNQAIYVAAGMVVNGNNSSTCSQYDIVTRWINLACLSAHESFSVKFGSIIALGLVNAGGQNVQISPFTNYGQLSVRKLSGLLIAMHYWFWYPLIQYFSLCFDPNHLILLDRNLDILDLQLQTDMPADAFAHMKIDVQGQNSIKSQFHTAVLSFVRDKNKLLNPISSSAQNTSTVESKISTVAPIENKEPGKSHKKVAAIQSDHSES
ncbi:MAG: proteasome regulatory particle base subunit, partial [Marteilia pararefringens]